MWISFTPSVHVSVATCLQVCDLKRKEKYHLQISICRWTNIAWLRLFNKLLSQQHVGLQVLRLLSTCDSGGCHFDQWIHALAHPLYSQAERSTQHLHLQPCARWLCRINMWTYYRNSGEYFSPADIKRHFECVITWTKFVDVVNAYAISGGLFSLFICYMMAFDLIWFDLFSVSKCIYNTNI